MMLTVETTGLMGYILTNELSVEESFNQKSPQHTCLKLWTEICEIRQIFKGDLIKFCESFIKITLELP